MHLCRECRYFYADALTSGPTPECSAPGNAGIFSAKDFEGAKAKQHASEEDKDALQAAAVGVNVTQPVPEDRKFETPVAEREPNDKAADKTSTNQPKTGK